MTAGSGAGAEAPVPPRTVPRYGVASLGDFATSLLAALGVPGADDVVGLGPAPRACVLLVDGLGWELLRTRAAASPSPAPFLAELLGDARVLTAGFPSTTATSLGSLGTGRPPGEHGLLGYQVAIPGEARLLNNLRWDDRVDPAAWQPLPTVFQRAAAAGVAPAYVGPGKFARSGLTRATARGATYLPADSPGELVAQAVAALNGQRRALVSVYYGDLDATGHRLGCRSAAWRFQLAFVDRLAEQLAAAVPPDVPLYITADHGMVDVDEGRRVDAQSVPELCDGVALLGGEARARHVYAVPGAAPDVLDAWAELLGDRMWVVPRDRAIEECWFGPTVSEGMLARIGDVIAAAHGDVAVTASATEPLESRLIGLHGSMTPEEELIPLLRVGGG